MRGVVRRAVGVGLAAVVSLVGLSAATAEARSGPAALEFQPSAHDYGVVSVGHKSDQQFQLTNTGGRGSSALTVTVSGSPTFAVTTDTCTGTSLGPGRSCMVAVRFSPEAGGPAAASVTAVTRNRTATVVAEPTGRGQRLGSPEPTGTLYWSINQGGGLAYSVYKAPLAGGVTSPVFGTINRLNYIAVDGSYVYWTNGSDNTVRRTALTGGPSITLASGQNDPEGIAIDGANVYWADFQGAAIKTVPLGGGTVTTLVTGENGPTGVAVDGSYVYWSTLGGDIKRAPLTGGTATTLVSNQVNPAGVAVDLDNLYWANSGDPTSTNGTINSAPLADGPHTRSTLLAGLAIPVGVAVHDGLLYWATAGDGNISSMPVASGPVTTVLSGLSTPEALAIGP